MILRLTLFLLFPLLLCAEPGSPKTEYTAAELDKKITTLVPSLIESTIAIFVGNSGSGSGVIVSSDGLCISAAHVTTTPGQEVTVLLSDGRELPAITLGVDHGTDGSLLKITAPGPFPFRPYIKEKNYQVGDWIIVTGHPGGPVIGRPAPVRLGQIRAAGVTSGFNDAIVTDATVISGDSGGPLFNLEGEVIGINSNVGMDWKANQHVPLPAIIAKWDALMDSKTFGATDNVLQSDFPYDDPYQSLREKFLRELKNHPDHPDHTQPRFLPPYQMQAWLDRWTPSEQKATQPSLGLTLDLSNREIAAVTTVTPDSPAAKAGLQAGQIITGINGSAVNSPTAFALALKELDASRPITLTVNGIQEFTVVPTAIPARRHFPMPLAGAISMMMNEEASSKAPEEVEAIREKLLQSAPDLPSVVKIWRGEKLVVHGTAVAEDQILTKLSELGEISELEAHHQDSTSSLELLSKDEAYDLALLRTPSLKLTPSEFRIREPRVGSLVFTPSDEGPILGCITQPFRPSPKAGYEHTEQADSPTGWLGISFNQEGTNLIVATVSIGSPADTIGLLEGDLLVSLNGAELTDRTDLSKAITPKAPGEKIILVIKRGEEEITLRPILGLRPSAEADVFRQQSAMSDGALKSLSAKGGDLSKRRLGFPLALYHDQLISPQQAGTPLLDVKGRILGINIARSYRHRSLAIPGKSIDVLLWELQQ